MATTQTQIKDMQKDLDQIKELLADNLAKTAPNGASKGAEKAEAVARTAGENVKTFLSDRREQIGHAKDACETTIQNRPFVTTAAAFVGGALLMSLIKRRS
ncbi:MAG: hypothetical protein JJ879_09865 [Sneathiella sp.]|nr:hypothetical protein [Sneathiella sp.]